MTVTALSTDSLSIANTAAAKTAKSSTLDQSSFLKLMTTQLKTQDPFSPVDNTQMVAQMAQFSSVAGISEMNTSLSAIKESLSASRIGDAASWIGRNALVATDTATPLSDGRYAGEIALPDDASAVTLDLIDGNGTVVHSRALGEQNAGTVGFSWDGKAADGTPAAGGPLTIRVSARGPDGAIAATTASWAAIGGVQSPAGGATTRLVTPLGLIAPDAALKLG
ncbi:flagellar hook assembly protein FlgD [Sphingomonas montana]|uniref:flagellar hook assembly protein FlgD n=1 Tax=Sphingomonas montana TaxID=1843236 RepID=UPI00096CBF5D|nr:flagellar hook capping FlgD N-terminal domain-containing protein [Sphingomonas montana]